MDKRTIAFLKLRFPRLFRTLTKSYLAVKVVSELDRPRYLWCMLSKKPYFGTIMLAGQTWESRKPFMRALVADEAKRKQGYLKILEVGSWAGNSAILWASALKDVYAKRGLGDAVVVCVDAWRPFVTAQHNRGVNAGTLIMENAIRKRKIFNLFLHNIRCSGNDDLVRPLLGSSDEILPFLKEEKFDLAFVDAAHCYSNIIKDLPNAARLLRDGGVLCGDDLELQATDIDCEFAEKNKELDFVTDPKTDQDYHPGVTLAIRDFFGCNVSNFQGFWAMRKQGSGWSNVEIAGVGSG